MVKVALDGRVSNTKHKWDSGFCAGRNTNEERLSKVDSSPTRFNTGLRFVTFQSVSVLAVKGFLEEMSTIVQMFL